MNIKLCHAAQKRLESCQEFSPSSIYTWWPERVLPRDREEAILPFIHKDDKYQQDYDNHIIASYFINNMKIHACIHNETELPNTDGSARLDKNDLIRLSTYQNARTLCVKRGTFDNLQDGWKTFVADFDHVYRSSADYMFHGYTNEAGDDFVTMMCVKWKNGMQNIFKEFTEQGKTGIVWHEDDLFVCIGYDQLVRYYSQFVVCYDASYWIRARR
jgi:hypothetical protein